MEPSIPELCDTQLLWHHCLTPPISRRAQLKSGAEIKCRKISFTLNANYHVGLHTAIKHDIFLK